MERRGINLFEGKEMKKKEEARDPYQIDSLYNNIK